MWQEKDELLNEGKTKKIWNVKKEPHLVIVENKNEITAFDDPAYTKKFNTKAAYATNTTCRVFELLEKARIPTAYTEQISSTEFVAEKCSMIPLEAVARRYAVGSYIKRNPQLTTEGYGSPHRFHSLVIEFFLKTSRGKLVLPNKDTLIEGLDTKNGEEDPLILNPSKQKWSLFHSKKPLWDPNANLNKQIGAADVLGEQYSESISKMTEYLFKTFLVLEGAWNMLSLNLIDLKIEFGIRTDKRLVVADVIDNDSWRLRDSNWTELSKESFRQGEKLTDVETKYSIVSSLVNRVTKIPDQALIFWRGSEKDNIPDMPITFGCYPKIITISGHKRPQRCLEKLNKIIAEYPDGGVIVVKTGRSNGLGPILAARTHWPVIAMPATIEHNPEDIWSSIRMPSQVPLLTAWPEENALLAAENILALKNPILYMKRKMEIESFDI
jgi:phosphoribosylaminoimidazole carboxylase/phosphoribosylaminoimidazole-succinocarboxamide synthase